MSEPTKKEQAQALTEAKSAPPSRIDNPVRTYYLSRTMSNDYRDGYLAAMALIRRVKAAESHAETTAVETVRCEGRQAVLAQLLETMEAKLAGSCSVEGDGYRCHHCGLRKSERGYKGHLPCRAEEP